MALFIEQFVFWLVKKSCSEIFIDNVRYNVLDRFLVSKFQINNGMRTFLKAYYNW